MGPNRSGEGMQTALQKILDIKQNGLPKVEVSTSGVFNVNWRTAIEVSITLDLAELIIRSALFRKETLGHHFRSDFPEAAKIPQHTLVKKKGQDIEVSYKSVRKLN